MSTGPVNSVDAAEREQDAQRVRLLMRNLPAEHILVEVQVPVEGKLDARSRLPRHATVSGTETWAVACTTWMGSGWSELPTPSWS